MIRVRVDRGLCDGNGLCALEAPTIFALDENDELRLLREEAEDGEAEAVDAAINACPKAALSRGD